ncbi:hypothetical protein [Paraburkholderia youngii]|uniref:Uncharacterized protein n=1 Tax=Paraburkholderia youngii TaxID=2782701 RepID=A0A7Y6N240_9BURK|nr:hypothetical protein [Paraburkholderia youngii]NUY05823.1 hypothetical protein [Paraburkholderia youngii]
MYSVEDIHALMAIKGTKKCFRYIALGNAGPLFGLIVTRLLPNILHAMEDVSRDCSEHWRFSPANSVASSRQLLLVNVDVSFKAYAQTTTGGEPCVSTPSYPACAGEVAVEANGFGSGLTIQAVLLGTPSE